MTNEEYHAHPAINRSRLFELEHKPPAYFKWREKNPRESTAALEFGQAFHTILLEPHDFVNRYSIIPECDKRTKAGRNIYADFLVHLGTRKGIEQKSFDTICGMESSIITNADAKALLTGQIETPIFWTDEETGEECKCKPDVLKMGEHLNCIVDLKSCERAETDSFMRDAIKYGYDVEAAMYISGVKAKYGVECDFVFVAVEKSAPHMVNIMQADPFFIDYGMMRYRRLLKLYSECKTTDTWPGYNGTDGDQNWLTIPNYLLKELE